MVATLAARCSLFNLAGYLPPCVREGGKPPQSGFLVLRPDLPACRLKKNTPSSTSASRMEPLSSTNDLARAISQFDEASVLALLKQARAC